MKTFIVTLLLCFLVKVSIQESKSLLDLLGVESRVANREPGVIVKMCEETLKPAVCQTCTKLNVCNYGEITCPKEKPLCVESALGDYCSDFSSDEECKPEIKPISCTGQGIYPDPIDCKVVHLCGEVGTDNSEVTTCPEGYVFSFTTKDCFRSARATDCISLTCDPTKIFSRFGTNNMYYGHCKPNDEGVVTAVAVYKCTDGATFDGNVCKFTCPREGKFPDTNNSNRYIYCFRPVTGTGFVYKNDKCPSSQKFDAKTAKCV